MAGNLLPHAAPLGKERGFNHMPLPSRLPPCPPLSGNCAPRNRSINSAAQCINDEGCGGGGHDTGGGGDSDFVASVNGLKQPF